ncbi:hypothetical protein [Methanobrevibacter sp.]|uniref:hypothetical protein n=1 Tax=Methanobrevibacter sp. TaxID=66852 RepID=UPI00386E4225
MMTKRQLIICDDCCKKDYCSVKKHMVPENSQYFICQNYETEKKAKREYTCWKHRDGGYIDLSHYTKTRMHVKKRIKLPKEIFE